MITSRVNAFKLCDDPLVFVTQIHSNSPYVGDLYPIADRLVDRPFYCLVVPAFSIYNKPEENKRARINAFNDARAKYSNMTLVSLCNEDVELTVFEGTDIGAVVINQNAFVDESLFCIVDEEKRYQAVYNAQLKSFKRHFLAKELESVALLYYGGKSDLEYLDEISKILPNGVFLNGQPDHNGRSCFKFFRPEDVCRIYNQARVGLCLSAVEGAMYASMEYLLCGLPVVSTENFGGRDEFADADFWITVSADAQSVKQATEILCRRNMPPHFIREKTLKKVYLHRKRLFQFLNLIFERHNQPQRRFEDEFPRLFKDKMWKNVCEIEEIICPRFPPMLSS